MLRTLCLTLCLRAFFVAKNPPMGATPSKRPSVVVMAKSLEVSTSGANVMYDPNPNQYFIVLTSGSQNNPATDLHTMVHVTDVTYSESAAVKIIRGMGCGSRWRHTQPCSVYGEIVWMAVGFSSIQLAMAGSLTLGTYAHQ